MAKAIVAKSSASARQRLSSRRAGWVRKNVVMDQRKLDVARQLGSRAMRAHAIESVTCGWLSLVVVVGLIANLLFGAWWIDAMASLGIVWFVVKEAREAWRGDDCCSHREDHVR